MVDVGRRVARGECLVVGAHARSDGHAVRHVWRVRAQSQADPVDRLRELGCPARRTGERARVALLDHGRHHGIVTELGPDSIESPGDDRTGQAPATGVRVDDQRVHEGIGPLRPAKDRRPELDHAETGQTVGPIVPLDDDPDLVATVGHGVERIDAVFGSEPDEAGIGACREQAGDGRTVPGRQVAQSVAVGGHRHAPMLPGRRGRTILEFAMARYMVIEHFREGDAVPVYRRFRDRGRLAPDGLVYVASWVDDAMRRCYQVMETDDRALLDAWIANWADLVEFEVIRS